MPRKNKKEECFFYMRGKCARDAEHPIAIKPCEKLCEFFKSWERFLNGLSERDYED